MVGIMGFSPIKPFLDSPELREKFGGSAVSVSESMDDGVRAYIKNQEEHRKRKL